LGYCVFRVSKIFIHGLIKLYSAAVYTVNIEQLQAHELEIDTLSRPMAESAITCDGRSCVILSVTLKYGRQKHFPYIGRYQEGHNFMGNNNLKIRIFREKT
jgi:hypothetical protein